MPGRLAGVLTTIGFLFPNSYDIHAPQRINIHALETEYWDLA